VALVWKTSLEHVGSFLETAKRHERDIVALWVAIEHEQGRLIARALETPLEHIASFQSVAKKHDRDTNALWKELENKPKQISAMAMHTSVSQLAGFCRHAPASLIKIALANLQTTHWDDIPVSESLVGGTWVASRCAEAGRADLESALITTLLRRASSQDFPSSLSSSFANTAWLLIKVPSGAMGLVPAFLDAICTKKWLGTQFTFAACGSLAKGLRFLALHQPAPVRRRFQNPSLGIRLQKELSGFAEVERKEQSQIIQLLGCSMLCGWPPKAGWFRNVPLNIIGALPVETLPHRAEADKVEDWQFELWIGLRAVTVVTGKPLAVPAAVIDRTLDLWRSNLAETSIDTTSNTHRLNQSMVAWLERCSREGRGLLPPEA
jgi:hypothetical protein